MGDQCVLHDPGGLALTGLYFLIVFLFSSVWVEIRYCVVISIKVILTHISVKLAAIYMDKMQGWGGRGHRKYYWFEWRWNVRKTGVAIYWNVQRMTTARQKSSISSISHSNSSGMSHWLQKKKIHTQKTQSNITKWISKDKELFSARLLRSQEMHKERLCQTNLVCLHLFYPHSAIDYIYHSSSEHW